MNEWSQKIRDLHLTGLSYQKIGALVGCAASTIGDLATGRSTEPKGGLAIRLSDLHRSKAKAIKAAKAAQVPA
jgi:hypothetical protein